MKILRNLVKIRASYYGISCDLTIYPVETQPFFIPNSVVFHTLYVLKFMTFGLYSAVDHVLLLDSESLRYDRQVLHLAHH